MLISMRSSLWQVDDYAGRAYWLARYTIFSTTRMCLTAQTGLRRHAYGTACTCGRPLNIYYDSYNVVLLQSLLATLFLFDIHYIIV